MKNKLKEGTSLGSTIVKKPTRGPPSPPSLFTKLKDYKNYYQDISMLR